MDFTAVVIGVYRCRTAMHIYFSAMAWVFSWGCNHIISIENRHVWDIVFYRVNPASMSVLYSGPLSIFEIGL